MIINFNDNVTVKELLNRFLIKANYDKKKKMIYFLFSGKAINPQEKRSIKNDGIKQGSVIFVDLTNVLFI